MRNAVPEIMYKHIMESLFKINWEEYLQKYPKTFSMYFHWKQKSPFPANNAKMAQEKIEKPLLNYDNKIVELFEFFNSHNIDFDIAPQGLKGFTVKVWDGLTMLLSPDMEDITVAEERLINNCFYILENQCICPRCTERKENTI